MRALWSSTQNCSHNMSQKLKRIRHFSSLFWWESPFFCAFLRFFALYPRANNCNLLENGEFHSDPVCTDPVENFPMSCWRNRDENFAERNSLRNLPVIFIEVRLTKLKKFPPDPLCRASGSKTLAEEALICEHNWVSLHRSRRKAEAVVRNRAGENRPGDIWPNHFVYTCVGTRVPEKRALLFERSDLAL